MPFFLRYSFSFRFTNDFFPFLLISLFIKHSCPYTASVFSVCMHLIPSYYLLEFRTRVRRDRALSIPIPKAEKFQKICYKFDDFYSPSCTWKLNVPGAPENKNQVNDFFIWWLSILHANTVFHASLTIKSVGPSCTIRIERCRRLWHCKSKWENKCLVLGR
jgi:hypothetical protein